MAPLTGSWLVRITVTISVTYKMDIHIKPMFLFVCGLNWRWSGMPQAVVFALDGVLKLMNCHVDTAAISGSGSMPG